MKIKALLNDRFARMLSVVFVVMIINSQFVYSEIVSEKKNEEIEYIIIGIPKEIKTIFFKHNKQFELVSGNEHEGKTMIYLPLDFHQIIFKDYYELYKMVGGSAKNISEKSSIPFLKKLSIPLPFDRNEGKQQIFYAKQYFLPEGFSNSVPDSLLLEVIYKKSFRIIEGTPQYEDSLKTHRIKLKEKPSVPQALGAFAGETGQDIKVDFPKNSEAITNGPAQ